MFIFLTKTPLSFLSHRLEPTLITFLSRGSTFRSSDSISGKVEASSYYCDIVVSVHLSNFVQFTAEGFHYLKQ